MQMDLFEYLEEKQAANTYEAILEDLWHYGIDDIYLKLPADKTYTITQVREKLQKNKNYDEYTKELKKRLIQFSKLVDNDTMHESHENCISEYDNESIRYRVVSDNIDLMGPVLCLSSMHKDFFIKEEQ